MKNQAFDAARFQFLRRTAAGVVIAAVPLLFASAGIGAPLQRGLEHHLQQLLGWRRYLDAALALSCFVSPLNALACAGLAVV